MTAEAMRRLRDAGLDEAMLGVDAANPTGALELYLGLGFEVDRRGQQFSWPQAIEDRT
jgi:ribosomal protein S18 acetylase RimI-like enzyme